MKAYQGIRFGLALAVAVVAVTGCGTTAQYPSKPIEMIVAASPGGGSDNMARNIVSVIDKGKYLPQPINVVNEPGSTKTFPDIGRKPGDGYTIGIGNEDVLGAVLTLRAQGQAGFTPKDVTWVARMAIDVDTITVAKDSPYKTFKDFVDDAKKRPGQIKAGGSDLGGTDDTVLLKIEKATGAKVNYVRYKSGGESMAALLGGHVDVLSANPNEIAGQLEAGTVRPLAITGDQRLSGLKDTPTMKELGVDVVLKTFRGVIGPKTMDAKALETIRAALKKTSEDKGWQDNYMTKQILTSAYLAGPDYDKFVDEQYSWWENSYKELGILK